MGASDLYAFNGFQESRAFQLTADGDNSCIDKPRRDFR
jgi:hypothetical protein